MNITRERSNGLHQADRPVWPNHEDLVSVQSLGEGESPFRVDAPPPADRIEAFFLHALGALDPEELEDLLHGD
jgi:hypothetical protein